MHRYLFNLAYSALVSQCSPPEGEFLRAGRTRQPLSASYGWQAPPEDTQEVAEAFHLLTTSGFRKRAAHFTIGHIRDKDSANVIRSFGKVIRSLRETIATKFNAPLIVIAAATIILKSLEIWR
ncbi:MAG: hypothetical protein OXU68_07090 [Bacteroidota bacterium]|nr:hypothetical protein [Bacteroidota bacterium]